MINFVFDAQFYVNAQYLICIFKALCYLQAISIFHVTPACFMFSWRQCSGSFLALHYYKQINILRLRCYSKHLILCHSTCSVQFKFVVYIVIFRLILELFDTHFLSSELTDVSPIDVSYFWIYVHNFMCCHLGQSCANHCLLP